MSAVENGNLDCLKELVKAGADINIAMNVRRMERLGETRRGKGVKLTRAAGRAEAKRAC